VTVTESSPGVVPPLAGVEISIANEIVSPAETRPGADTSRTVVRITDCAVLISRT
jgi:hypothetical protein